MFKSELKKYLEQLKESCPLKDATFRDFAPLIGMLAVCTTIAVFWNVSNSLFLKMVGYAVFLSLFWFQLYEKVKDLIVEVYLMQKRSRYGYLKSIEQNFIYSLFLSSIIYVASYIFEQTMIGFAVIGVTIFLAIMSSIKFLKDKKPIYMTSVDIAMRRREIIDLFKSRYGFEISLVRDLKVVEDSVRSIIRLGYLDYYLNVMKDYDAWMKFDLEEANRHKHWFFENLENQIFNYAVERGQAEVLNNHVSKAIKAVVYQKIDIAHYLD